MTALYIDSSQPSPGGGGMWKNDSSISFNCYKKNYTPVQACSCTKYKVYHTVYQNGTVPPQVKYLSGVFVKEENPENTFGLLAPLYIDREKNLTTTPLRGIFSQPSCPDTDTIPWEWYNATTS